MVHAINRHGLINTIPCINNTFHALLKTGIDFGKIRGNTEASARVGKNPSETDSIKSQISSKTSSASLQLQISMKYWSKSCTDSDIVQIKEQMILSDNFTESDLTKCISDFCRNV